MCGLAGWVDYTRKLDDEFPAIFANLSGRTDVFSMFSG